MTDPTLKVASATATRVRYTVLGLLCLLAMITYLDRAAVANSKDDILAAVGRPAADWFWLLVAFQVAYALFEVPSGWMGDTFGPRVTIIRIVLWWSVFIGLTGLAGHIEGWDVALFGFGTLVVIQFLFGMGEAGAFPNITRALYNWFPASERGFAQGAIWMSARFMGGLAPLTWLLMTGADFGGLSWRQGFWVFAAAAFVWCAGFAWWFRNRPEEHAAVNEAECRYIEAGKGTTAEPTHAGVPWGLILRSPNLRWICLMYLCTNYGWYFFMYFLPGFMKERFGSPDATPAAKVQIALLTGGPLLVGMLGCFAGGILTDRYVRRTGDRKWGRRLYGMLGFGLCGVFYLLAVAAINAPIAESVRVYAFAGFIALAGFCNDLTMGPCWATCQDIGRRYAAIVSGCMNMIGNLGAAVTNMVTGLILRDRPGVEGYTICLVMYSVAYGLGVLFWTRIDATRPVVPDAVDPAAHA
jgi:MFS family permease